MPKYNKRTQVLLSEEQYERLLREAGTRGGSVASLIRDAVDQVYMSDRERKLKAVERIAAMNLPVSDWETIEKKIIEGHVSSLPEEENGEKGEKEGNG